MGHVFETPDFFLIKFERLVARDEGKLNLTSSRAIFFSKHDFHVVFASKYKRMHDFFFLRFCSIKFDTEFSSGFKWVRVCF